MHQLVDADTAGLKGVMENLNQARNMLEMDIEGLTATLFGMKNTHNEVRHYNDHVYIMGTGDHEMLTGIPST